MNITMKVENGVILYTNELGQFHREDGPAKIFPSGTKSWYFNGKLHREDGPAIEYASGTKIWYIHGQVTDKLIIKKDDPAYTSYPEKPKLMVFPQTTEPMYVENNMPINGTQQELYNYILQHINQYPTPKLKSNKQKLPKIGIWTDGSIYVGKNKSIRSQTTEGGWGAIIKRGKSISEFYGYKLSTSSTIMEYFAVINGIQQIKYPSNINLYSDFNSVAKCGRILINNNSSYKYRLNKLKSLKYRANNFLWLIANMIEACKPHNVYFKHVTGHSGIPNNEKVDQLAKMAMKKARSISISNTYNDNPIQFMIG